MLGRRANTKEMESKQDGHYRDEVTEPQAESKLTEMG